LVELQVTILGLIDSKN